MKTPEKSVEEIVEGIINDIAGTRYYFNDERHEYGQIPGLNAKLKATITQTLQTERQKREEMIRELLQKVEDMEIKGSWMEKANIHNKVVWKVIDLLQALTQPNNK